MEKKREYVTRLLVLGGVDIRAGRYRWILKSLKKRGSEARTAAAFGSKIQVGLESGPDHFRTIAYHVISHTT